MTATEGQSDVLEALAESVCDDPSVAFAVVFGSQATGDTTPSSDIDLAVKFRDDLAATERFRTRCTLAGALQQEDAPFIDVADLDALPLAVAHDAVQGRLICGDEPAFRAVKAEVEAAFADQGEAIQRRQDAVIDRIAEEGLRG